MTPLAPTTPIRSCSRNDPSRNAAWPNSQVIAPDARAAAINVSLVGMAGGGAEVAASVIDGDSEVDPDGDGDGDGEQLTTSIPATRRAGVTGKLDAVGFYVSATGPGPTVQVQPAVGNAVIEIEGTASGLPVSPPLASATPTLGSAPGWVYFILPSPINIVAGTKYAILMWTGAPVILNWAGDCSNSYPGGEALVFRGGWFSVDGSEASPAYCQQDFAFQTYVTAAPPATTAPPAATAPPTSTTPAKRAPNGGPAIPVIVAGFAAAAAFVTMRRYGLARR